MWKKTYEWLLRATYSSVLYILLPVTVYYLIWRGFRVRDYFERWSERYAAYRQTGGQPRIWLHAVSVGEVNAAGPLVDSLRHQYPGIPWVITTTTPTGSARVRALWGHSLEHVYLPYDTPGSVGRFLDHFRPQLALILETELWPNMLFGCHDRSIPVYILNARLSARSLRGYHLLRPLIGCALRTVRCVAAQSIDDAQRFLRLGARLEQVVALGNLKFDIAVPRDVALLIAEVQTELTPQRPVWIAASTHEGEEAAVVAMHRHLRARFPSLLLLWAPRHPERFSKVETLVREQHWIVHTRCNHRRPSARTDVFIIDTLGELMLFYGCAQAAFVGGSLQAIGGHNLLEPAAMGTAMVSGQHLHNFYEISKSLQQVGALEVCQSAREVADALERLLADPQLRAQRSQAGLALVASGRGTVARILETIGRDLPSTQAYPVYVA